MLNQAPRAAVILKPVLYVLGLGFLVATGLLFWPKTVVAANWVRYWKQTPEEKKIVGTWQSIGIDTPIRTVFRRDHTVVEMFPEDDSPNSPWLAFQAGSWQLVGNKIVTETRGLRFGDIVLSDRGYAEMPLLQIQPDRLVRAENRPELVRVSVLRERYLQVIFSLFAMAGVGALVSLFYWRKKLSVRTVLAVLLSAAAATSLWATLNLICQLTQTGSVILSPASVQSIRQPTALSGIIATGSIVFGLVALWRSRLHQSGK